MAKPPIGTHVQVALDISGDVAPQIAFDFLRLVDDLAYFYNVVIGEGVGLEIQRHSGFSQYFSRRAAPNPEDISQRYFHSFVAWKIDSGNTCHTFPPAEARISPVAACAWCSRTRREPRLFDESLCIYYKSS